MKLNLTVKATLDRDYVAARDKLILEAETYANKRNGSSCAREIDESVRERWAAAWNYDFHTQMNVLARQRLGALL